MERRQQIAFALLLVACIFMALLLTGCSGTTVEREDRAQEHEEETTSMFVLVEKANSWVVVYHRETKVMYAVSWSGYNLGNFTVMVNADGSPMLWEG